MICITSEMIVKLKLKQWNFNLNKEMVRSFSKNIFLTNILGKSADGNIIAYFFAQYAASVTTNILQDYNGQLIFNLAFRK